MKQKFIIGVLFFGWFSAHASEKQFTEGFNYFLQLPVDMQKIIINLAWNDSYAHVKRQLFNWDYFFNYKQLASTDFAERKKYDFHGKKIPIHFNTYHNNGPTIFQVGTILVEAQPAILFGLMSAITNVRTSQLFLKDCNVELKNGNVQDPDICGCALSVYGDIAIVWKWHDHLVHPKYITFSHLDILRKEKTVDLALNKIDLDLIEIKMINNFTTTCGLKGLLFNRQGTQLIVSYTNRDKNKLTAVQCIDVPNKDKKLSSHQIAKRLMISNKLFLDEKKS